MEHRNGRATVRDIARLAIPATIAGVLQYAFRPLDQFYVKWLGMDAQGALGADTFVIILAQSAFLVISAGAGPLVARAIGSRDPRARRRVLGSALVGCAGIAVVLATVGSVAAPWIAGWLGLQGTLAAYATTYLRTLFLSGAALVFAPLVDASFAAMGNTWLPMKLEAASVLLNAVLTPTLVYGAGLGVAGAALGSTAAQTVTVLVGLRLLWQETGLRGADLGVVDLPRIARIGAPMALSVALYALVYWALLATSISPLGPAVNAGLGIGFSALESFSWPLFLGVSVAASSLVGRYLGAGLPEEAWRTVRRLLPVSAALGTVVWSLFWFAGPCLTGLFAGDEASWRQATLYAAVLAWSQPFVAVEALMEGVLAGAGDTRAVFWTTVPLNLLRVPLAWVLAFPLGLGAAGVWWAIDATTVMKACAKGAMVAAGRWSTLRL